MSRTLTLIGAGWASVRSSAAHGRRTDTLNRLRSLLARPDLPTSVACEAHRLAGELLVEAERYPKARRHLRLAAGIAPTQAQTFYLWGLAHERDPHGCDRLAAKQFRKASELEPGNSTYRAAFGRAAVRCDRLKRGVRELLTAAVAAPGDVAVIRVVTEGLIEAGRLDAARRVLNKARFLCFGIAKDRELVDLWERVRFETARCVQRETTRHRQDAEFATDGGRVVLPFVRLAKETRTGTKSESDSSESTRRDVVSMPRPHFPRLRVRRADR
jgi:hypothetical protein